MSHKHTKDMLKAFILINCEPGSDDKVIEDLQVMDGVISTLGTFGSYDVISLLHSESQEKLDDIITKKMRKLEKIQKTTTLLVEKRSNEIDELFNKKQEQQKNRNLAEAFVIVRFKPVLEGNILYNLGKIPQIIDGDTVVGEDEIICKVVAQTYNEIEDVVTKKIRKLEDIVSTMTLNVIPAKRIS